MKQALQIKVRGIVQGVGFRPFVYAQAVRNNLRGWVRNTSSGVDIHLVGDSEGIDAFLTALRQEPPPLARIDEILTEAVEPGPFRDFSILESQPVPGEFLPVSPDVSLCSDCQRELLDPANRRYRYPFINCTNCGPRFTITRAIPYDRPNTTMAAFPLCPACQAEYDDPLNRRFHAQPIACPECGPQVRFETAGQSALDGESALAAAAAALRQGKIIAVKGLGGYHLACDAHNREALRTMRERKRRSAKPFAVMAANTAVVEKYCLVSEEERLLLESPARPILLLQKRPGELLPDEISPGQNTLGFMLAYTPLHVLLLNDCAGFTDVLVMTSANLGEEPIVYRDEDASARLADLADGQLSHNRPIYMRTDDSVARVIQGKLYPIRRARGYAPDPVRLPFEVTPLLAAGAELKNTFCLTRDRYVFLSHHIGDMENYETLQSYREGVGHYKRLFHIDPECIVCDLHPDYLASRQARADAQENGLPLMEVQHHHAHLAACLADNGWETDQAVIGLTYDGTGYGTDGTIWGGEVLVGAYSGYQRRFHLEAVPQPGGDLSVRHPARMALAHLWAAGLDWPSDCAPAQALCSEERTALRLQLERRLNTPLTSSMGRLLDAAAALAGVRQKISYEGQAAIEFEALADWDESGGYPLTLDHQIIRLNQFWQAYLSDLLAGVPVSILSARVHQSIIQISVDICERIRAEENIQTVALSGGVWQNRYLLEHTTNALTRRGFSVLLHRQVPANDGGISLGQAVIAGWKLKNL